MYGFRMETTVWYYKHRLYRIETLYHLIFPKLAWWSKTSFCTFCTCRVLELCQFKCMPMFSLFQCVRVVSKKKSALITFRWENRSLGGAIFLPKVYIFWLNYPILTSVVCMESGSRALLVQACSYTKSVQHTDERIYVLYVYNWFCPFFKIATIVMFKKWLHFHCISFAV